MAWSRTVYPGWYATRTAHIHVKVRLYFVAGDKTFEATSQLYFDDAVTDTVYAQPPYVARGPRSIPKNTNDQVYNGTGVGITIDTIGPPQSQAPPGEKTLAALKTVAGGPGYTAKLNIGLQMG